MTLTYPGVLDGLVNDAGLFAFFFRPDDQISELYPLIVASLSIKPAGLSWVQQTFSSSSSQREYITRLNVIRLRLLPLFGKRWPNESVAATVQSLMAFIVERGRLAATCYEKARRGRFSDAMGDALVFAGALYGEQTWAGVVALEKLGAGVT